MAFVARAMIKARTARPTTVKTPATAPVFLRNLCGERGFTEISVPYQERKSEKKAIYGVDPVLLDAVSVGPPVENIVTGTTDVEVGVMTVTLVVVGGRVVEDVGVVMTEELVEVLVGVEVVEVVVGELVVGEEVVVVVEVVVGVVVVVVVGGGGGGVVVVVV